MVPRAPSASPAASKGASRGRVHRKGTRCQRPLSPRRKWKEGSTFRCLHRVMRGVDNQSAPPLRGWVNRSAASSKQRAAEVGTQSSRFECIRPKSKDSSRTSWIITASSGTHGAVMALKSQAALAPRAGAPATDLVSGRGKSAAGRLTGPRAAEVNALESNAAALPRSGPGIWAYTQMHLASTGRRETPIASATRFGGRSGSPHRVMRC